MDRALRVVCLEYGIDPVTAGKMLSTNPARHVGILDRVGTVEVGKQADLVAVDRDFSVITVLKSGKVI